MLTLASLPAGSVRSMSTSVRMRKQKHAAATAGLEPAEVEGEELRVGTRHVGRDAVQVEPDVARGLRDERPTLGDDELVEHEVDGAGGSCLGGLGPVGRAAEEHLPDIGVALPIAAEALHQVPRDDLVAVLLLFGESQHLGALRAGVDRVPSWPVSRPRTRTRAGSTRAGRCSETC